MANMVSPVGQEKTQTGPPARTSDKVLNYKGNFGATQGAETIVDVIPVSAYRSIVISVQASAWGVGTVAFKVYSCDQAGNSNTNALFSLSFTANAGPTLLYLAEMGGSTSSVTWPPASQATGVIIGPFGSFLKITEQMTAFTSGTNTVACEVECKG